MECDFCSTAENLAWSYPCKDFVDPLTMSKCVGNWLACVECSELIEKGDTEELRRRSLAAFPGNRVLVHAYVGYLHAEFLKHREGERIPHGRDPHAQEEAQM